MKNNVNAKDYIVNMNKGVYTSAQVFKNTNLEALSSEEIVSTVYTLYDEIAVLKGNQNDNAGAKSMYKAKLNCLNKLLANPSVLKLLTTYSQNNETKESQR